MIKAIAIKELREIAGIACIGLLLYLMLVVSITGGGPMNLIPFVRNGIQEIPFASNGSFLSNFIMISLLLAAALGYWQSVRESRQGTFLFLLHRPWPREKIFLTKLAVGAGLLLVCEAIPIVYYGCWAAMPGNVPAPFEWSMSFDACWWCGLMTMVYLGAFLSGIRPGAWYGTRLLPLFGAGTLCVLIVAAPWGWSLGLTALMLVDAVLIYSICHVVRSRDYS